MTKSELVVDIANSMEVSIAMAQNFVNTLEDVVIDVVGEGVEKEISLGFCKIKISHKDKHFARNPKTGARVAVAAKNVVKMKVGSRLKRAANNE